MLELLFRNRFRWRLSPRSVTGDAAYGTRENVAAIEEAGIRAYVALPEQGGRTGLFPIEDFVYDAEKDLYTCPSGETLHRLGRDYKGGYVRYGAKPSSCEGCHLKGECTNSTKGRWLSRGLGEEYLERVRAYRNTEPYRKALRKRAVWVEPLFAEAKEWHGFRRFRESAGYFDGGMAGQTTLIVTTRSGVRPLGVRGEPLHNAAPQLRRVVRRRLGDDAAGLLADPQAHEDGKAIDWYADWPGAVQPLSALAPERRAEVLAGVERTLAEIRRLGDTLAGAGPREDMGVVGLSLQLAARAPAQSFIFLVGERPVIVCWGYEKEAAASLLPATLPRPPEPACSVLSGAGPCSKRPDVAALPVVRPGEHDHPVAAHPAARLCP